MFIFVPFDLLCAVTVAEVIVVKMKKLVLLVGFSNRFF